VRLRTQTTIPRGSGLGTSSILAGAVLACLDRLLGLPPSQARLFDEVLWLEQMLTTGGGWQDQAGGLVGGIKLVTTAPGLHQTLAVDPLVTTAATAGELQNRLLLVYTGQQRLAKNLLRAVMSRWMLRDPEMVWLMGEIGRLAVSMRDALVAGDVDGFGEMVGAHWELNKRMDPGCTNPCIDDLFAFMRPFIQGAKLAGAGGGGFAIVVANRGTAAQALRAALAAHYAGAPVRVWPHAIPDEGLRIT
jgi:fucokinase